MEDSWENLAGALPGLSLSERPVPNSVSVDTAAQAGDVAKPPTPPPAESTSAQPQYQAQQQQASGPASDYEAVDAAIRQALADPTQRITVLKCEELVEKFLADPCQEALQFPASFSSYQRMLAHRVGQYYGLQTSTVDYEESQGRVLAIRTMHCTVPKPRLRNLDVRSDPIAQRTSSVNGAGGPVSDKPRLLRRQEDERIQHSSSELSLNQSPSRTIKERHENYMKAREELGLGSAPQEGMGMGRGGRGGPGGRFGSLGGRMDGGRGRKAMFRDKDKDLSDPDYRRGMNRFTPVARFDPTYAAMPGGGIYQVPTYSSEFPALNRMPAGPAGAPGRPHMAPQHHADHSQVPLGAAGAMQPHPMAAHQPAGPMGSWGQSPAHAGPGGVRPPPPPPPPHHHVGGHGGSNQGGKAHQGGAAAAGGPDRSGSGGMAGRQQQPQQQAAAYGQAVAAPYPGMGAQYPVPVAMGAAGFMPPGQPVFGMAAAGGAIPAGAMYAAAAPGMGGAFYPGMGMGHAMGMAVPATGAYGYVTAPGVGMGSQGEAIAIAPQGAYPVYSYPAGAAMYPAGAAAGAQLQQAAQAHSAGGAAIPMRPMYGVPAFYQSYDPAQYGAGPGMQGQGGGQGEGRSYGGHAHHHQQQQHQSHSSSHNNHHSQQHGGGRSRETEREGAGAAASGAAADAKQ
ncbi:hypothetical protein Agub_g9936 [Astrephomene gubernaculifera]|uniref:R3H domain-containing protein n=1 Tax=Astrephomene gubernaculifera TaxID=47775 RepID=A0AAD3HPF4_9CHLO|nr:hypothetical protein Agub_g9936 [Astrephomene gubernaculifera]